MSKIKILYQTLEDRLNPMEVKEHGPYRCEHDKAWLGNGYYFWDTFIDLAHWWGKMAHKNKYIIGKIEYFYDEEKIYDLLDPDNLLDFQNYYTMLKQKTKRKYTVSAILQHMKEHTNFNYLGVRIRGEHSTKDIKENKVRFIDNRSSFLDMTPPIQICLFDDNDVKSYNYEIVYPLDYQNYNITDMTGMTI